jgi:PAS domain S-box-containing protein
MATDITQLIDFKKVDSLLEGFNKSTGFVTAILDLEGNILSKSGWRQICTEFHRMNPITSQNCTISDTILSNKLKQGEKYHFYKCLNGLVDVAVPLIINGEHVANLFSGQFFLEEPDKEQFIKQAQSYGFDEAKYLEFMSRVPVVSEEKARVALDFLHMMTQFIAEQSYQRKELFELSEQLRVSETQFKSVFESSNVGKSITSLTGEINVNKAFCEMLGFTPEELKNKKWQDITPKEEIPAIQKLIEPLIKGEKEGLRFEKRYICKDNSIVWADVSVSIHRNNKGTPLYFITTIVDVSDRKKNEQIISQKNIELKNQLIQNIELEKRLEFALSSSKTGAWDLDLRNHTAIRTLEHDKIFGYQELLPEWTYEIFLEHVLDEFKSDVDKKFKYAIDSKTEWNFECEIRRIDNETRWIWACGQHLLDENGETSRLAGIVQDITERKLLQQALEKVNADLELKVQQRTTQLEASIKELEAFSYSVSHDLRAPLRHINGYVDLLYKKYYESLDEKARHYLEIIAGASKQMGLLIDDLLQFSRTGRKKLSNSDIDMNTLVQEVLTELNPMIKEREIIWDIQDLPHVYGDYSLLKLVWTNLLDNALKYSQNQPLTKISVEFETDAKNFVFCVRDNGVGFDMNYAHKLFGVFQRLHSQHEFEGTGIGLANVQRIIHKHGGKVWAEAELNKGANFFFSLVKNQAENDDRT